MKPCRVKVEITRWVDDNQPGFVEFALVDAAGITHRFVEKVPIVTSEHLTAEDRYPRPAELDCVLVSPPADHGGTSVVTVDTAEPSGVSSIDGETQFVVRSDVVLLFDPLHSAP